MTIAINTVDGPPITAPAVVVGCMRLSDVAGTRALYTAAREAGLNMFDHADIYGGNHRCESLFGDLALSAAERSEIILQTKVGIRPGFYDSSAAHIERSVEASLRALGTDYLDILLIHRPDVLTAPEEIRAAFARLHAAGKVRAFGVSNHNARQVQALGEPYTSVNQVQLGPAHPNVYAHGLTVNMGAEQLSPNRDGGVLEQARGGEVVLQAYSPFQGSGGPFLLDERYAALNECLTRLAARHGVAPEAIVTAWVLRPPVAVQVVSGTTNPHRLALLAAGQQVVLDRAEWYEVYRLAGNQLP
ncbi:aldo/keto reductase [Buchananella hordeovulneris]|uniref:aldo/keto reductase n=1 Tax=Buchananella hordeovulneris TaxID=52770 RepID=UPI000F5E2BC0|nr:aldo/keto reductase [Buchananella hordeovulneris]RRD45440.1 aldo/keto reductase family oxidoreductase [Buchananella hordeovulneris]